jgi:hypothetical protein
MKSEDAYSYDAESDDADCENDRSRAQNSLK